MAFLPIRFALWRREQDKPHDDWLRSAPEAKIGTRADYCVFLKRTC